MARRDDRAAHPQRGRRRFGVRAAELGAALVLVTACTRPAPRPVTIRAATAPAALPPPSHTLDSAGWVDEAGRTTSQRQRTELSGMRPTEAGTQIPTGTPGEGLPLPIEPKTPPRPPEAPAEGSIAVGPPPAPGTVTNAVLRSVTLAFCEHEERCGRLSDEEGARCLEASDSRYREELGSAGCPFTFDVDDVVACLGAIRERPCAAPPEEVSRMHACAARAMCLPR